jgi:ribose transport system substrate-binding protein
MIRYHAKGDGSRIKRSIHQAVACMGALVLLSVVLAACSSTTKTAAPITKVKAVAPSTVSIPADIAKAYVSPPIKLTSSAYANFKAEKPPYTVAFANGNMGNTWRAQSLSDLQKAFSLYEKAGIVKGSLYAANADNSASAQISQLDSMIASHYDLILINAVSLTALNPTIERAYKAGIVVVAFNDIVSSPYAENRDINQADYADLLAKGLVEAIHGKGNIAMIEGLPGNAGNDIREVAAEKYFAKYPKIHVIANVAGDWTETGAETAMSTIIATHPEPINGVWQQGGMTTGVEKALDDAGRPLVPISYSGMWSGLQFWKSETAHGYTTAGSMDPPGGSVTALRVGIRILEGQHPLLNAVFNIPPYINQGNMMSYWKPGESPTAWLDPSSWSVVPCSVLNKYFSNGKCLAPAGA